MLNDRHERWLTIRQAEAWRAEILAMLRRFNGYQRRMKARGIREDDSIRRAAATARDALIALSVHLHYASIRSGCGQGPPPPDDEPPAGSG